MARPGSGVPISFNANLRINQSSARLRDFLTIFFRSSDPKLDGIFGIFDGVLPGRAMSHAAGKFQHVHDIGVVFRAPPDDYFIAVWFRGIHCDFSCSSSFFIPPSALASCSGGVVARPSAVGFSTGMRRSSSAAGKSPRPRRPKYSRNSAVVP